MHKFDKLDVAKPMTKQDALERLEEIDKFNKPINTKEVNWVLLQKLEALGLLKFEVEPKPYISYIYLDGRPFTLKEIIIALANQGYAVDKIK